MLVLSRKSGQRVVIGEGDDRVVLTVLAIRGNHVRVGIEAPDHVRIDREEVALRIELETEKECA